MKSRIGWASVVGTVIIALFVAFSLDQPLRLPVFVAVGEMILGPVLLATIGRSRVARTAEGTAQRIQALGFKQYLTTAEAEQIRFEEAAGIFSRYLPYAIVFGVADRWAKIFGKVAAQARLQGIEMPLGDLAWFTLDTVTDLMVLDLLTGGGLTDMITSIDFSSLADGLGESVGSFVEGVGDFVGSVDGLGSLGDGCDGCDLDF